MSLVDTVEAEDMAIAKILECVPNGPLAVDCEGIDLGRSGELCILQVGCVTKSSAVVFFLFDVCVLGRAMFDRGLRQVLENADILKLVYDARSDSDALFAQFDVRLRGLIDLQVAFMKTKQPDARYLFGMKKALIAVGISAAFKDDGQRLFLPENGGTFQVWKQRPLIPQLVCYASDDTASLFKLWNRLKRSVPLSKAQLVKMSDLRAQMAREATRELRRRCKWNGGVERESE